MGISKRKKITIGFIVLSLIILIGVVFVLNNRFHIFADILSTGDYTIFQKENFAQVGWDTTPAPGEILQNGATISTFAAKGQTEDISFSVRPNPNKDLGDVTLDIPDLRMGDKVIPKANIEVLNLKIWDQCESKPQTSVTPNEGWIENCNNSNTSPAYLTTKTPMPELLVHDNEQDLVSAEPGWDSSTHIYTAPTVNQGFKATLKANKTHTFYLRITVPTDATEGSYSGLVTFRPQSSYSPNSQNLNLSLRVEPFVLPDSGKQIITHATFRVNDSDFQDGRANISGATVAERKVNYGRYLDFLRQSGFTGLIVNDYNNIGWVASEMKAKGFTRLIWRPFADYTYDYLSNPDTRQAFTDKLTAIENYYPTVYIYGVDEPNNPNGLIQNMKFAKWVHAAGAKMADSISKEVLDANNNATLGQLAQAGVTKDQAKIDLPIYANMGGNSDVYDNVIKYNFDKPWSLSVNQKRTSYGVYPNGIGIGPSSRYTPPPLSADTWHHIAGIWDSEHGIYKMYVDGNTADEHSPNSDLIGFTLLKNTGDTIIGAYGAYVSNPLKDRNILGFKGQIADIKIYNSALTADQINNSSVAPQTNYDFSSGTYASCNPNDITVVNDGPSQIGSKSLSFNGSSSYLNCTETNNYGITGSMTVEAWIKQSDASASQNVIISKSWAQDHAQTDDSQVENYISGIFNGKTAKNSFTEFNYSQIWPEYGTLANRRRSSGFFLDASGLDGFAPFGLDAAFQVMGNKYYDDFDPYVYNNGNSKIYMKDEFSVLPTADGNPLFSYQFEAFRTGVDDTRYYTLYKDLLERLKAKDPARAELIDQPVRLKLTEYLDYSFVKSNSDHQATRRLVADKIVEIQSVLNPPPIPSPTPSRTPPPIPTPTPSPRISPPIATPTPTVNISLKKGYNTVDSNQRLNTQSLTAKGLTVFGFNQTGDKAWGISNSSKSSLSKIKPGLGYYVYSPLDQTVSASIVSPGLADDDFTVIRQGWNLLSNSSDQPKKLSDLTYPTIKTGQVNTCPTSDGACFETKKLSELFAPTSKRVWRTYVIIKDGNTTDASKAFEYVEVTSANINTLTIPAHKAFWVYLFE